MKVVRLINLYAKSKSKESGGESGGELKMGHMERFWALAVDTRRAFWSPATL